MIILKFLTLTLIIIEIALNAKVYFHNYQEMSSYELPDKNALKILIIGDSISSDYPTNLNRILNSKLKKKKIIIEKLIQPNAAISYILDNIDKSLNRFKPNIVVSMLGKAEQSNVSKTILVKKNVSNRNLLMKLQIIKLTYGFYSTFSFSEMFNKYFIGNKKSDHENGSYLTEQTDQTGKELIKNKNWIAAEKHYRKKLESNKNSIEIKSILSEIYLKTGKNKEALGILLQIIKEDPEDRNLYSIISNLYIEEKDYGKAEHWALKGIQLFPNSKNIISGLMRLYGESQQFDKAIDLCSKLDAINVKDHLCFYYSGYNYYLKGEFSKALIDLFKSKALAQNTSYIDFKIAMVYYDNGEKELALKHYRLSLDSDPLDQNTNYYYIVRSIELNRLTTLKNYYFKHKDLKYPGNQKMFTAYGRIHMELKEYKASYRFLKKSLEFDPTDPFALKAMNLLRKRTNNFKLIDRNINYKNRKKISLIDDYYKLYPKIVGKIINADAKIILMQYPDMDINDLKEIKFKQKNKIAFIDNKRLFEKQSNNTEIEEYFVWDGLHLSKKGNEAISKNIVNIILRDLSI